MGQFTLLAMGTVSYFSLNILLFEGGTMAQKLDLYYYPECPYCQKVLRAMRSLGIEDKITLWAASTRFRACSSTAIRCMSRTISWPG